MTRRPLRERALGALLSVVSVAAIGVPAGIWWRLHSAPSDVARQHAVDIPEISDDDLVAYRDVARSSGADAPLILAYHDVRPLPDDEHGDPYTVRPEDFAEQMAMLRESGFRTISTDDLRRWLEGGDLPPRSLMITFDDGPAGLWKYADPVLEKLGFRATAFVVTSAVGHHRPYYLSWNELDRMRESGRWDIESHTRAGHGKVKTGRSVKETGPFLINRAWLAARDRLETLDEFSTRVRGDIAGSKSDLERRGFDTPDMFAFPFSAQVSPTNDERAPAFVSELIAHEFAGSMTNAEPAAWPSQRDRVRKVLPRIEVFERMSARDLFDRIAGAAPIAPRLLRPLDAPPLWVDSAGRPFDGDVSAATTTPRSSDHDSVRFAGRQIALAPKAGKWLGAFYAPGRLADWRSYTTSVLVAGLAKGGTGGVLVHVGAGDSAVSVSVSAHYVSVHRGSGDTDEQLAGMRLPRRDAHAVRITIANGRLSVRVDGTLVLEPTRHPEASSGSVALSASAQDAGAGAIVFRDLLIDGRTS